MSAPTMDWRSFVGAFFSDLFDQFGARMTSKDLCDWGCIAYRDDDRSGDIVALRSLASTTGKIESRLLTALPAVLCNLRELCLGSHMLNENGIDIASFFTPGGLPPQLESLVVSRNHLAPTQRFRSTCSVAIDGSTHSFGNLPRSLTHIDFRNANLVGRADFCGDDFPPRLATLWLEGNLRLELTGSIIDCAPFVVQTLRGFDIGSGVSVRLSPIHVTELAAFVDMSRRYKRGALSLEGVRAMMSSSVVGDDGTSSANSMRCFLACARIALGLQYQEAAKRRQIEESWKDDAM